jgi:hypothetical protein
MIDGARDLTPEERRVQEMNSLRKELKMWRERAHETADTNHQLRDKLHHCTQALDKIVHMGFRGDKHVDLAFETLSKVRGQNG